MYRQLPLICCSREPIGGSKHCVIFFLPIYICENVKINENEIVCVRQLFYRLLTDSIKSFASTYKLISSIFLCCLRDIAE